MVRPISGSGAARSRVLPRALRGKITRVDVPMTADPPGPSKTDFDARLRAARTKQAKREGRSAPGSRGSGSGIGFAFRIGTELVAGVVMGVAIGLGLDYWLDSKPWFMIVFFFLGAGAGMLNVYRTVTGIGHAVGYEKLDPPPKPGGGRDENGK